MNLLEDPVFTVRISDDPETCSLPRIYHLLQQDAVEEFVKLQAHQKQAWHCFLVQLGAIATEDRPMPNSEGGWREALSTLACWEAWNLYTEDLSKPAFMQPPVPEETLDDFSEIDVVADDVPSLAKNHGIKKNRIVDSNAEHWAYMLINVQTSDTYGGGQGGYPKSSRGMEGRAFLATTPSLRLGPWIMHDVQRLHGNVQEVVADYGYDRSGFVLLWTTPWGEPPGDESRIGPLSLDQLHPWYIDCCRRIRKGETWMITTADHMRVEEPPGGQTGDPWAPINANENRVLRPRDNTFRYDNLSSLLFTGGYIRPPGFSEVDDGYIVFRAMPKDYTERTSIRERIIRFYNAASDDPFETPDESQIAEEAQERVKKGGQAASIFSHALDWLFCKNAEEGPSSGLMSAYKKQNPDEPAKAYDRQENALHSRIDQNFFSRLFDAPDMDDAERYTFWETVLVDALRAQWNDAKHLCPEKDRWERVARAQSVFENRTRSTFTYAKQFANDDEHENTEDGLGQPDRRAVADLQ
jgi:CRISPR system Cascade subunit CasA